MMNYSIDVGAHCIPVSQFLPVNPRTQEHRYALTKSLQVALFLQGEVWHSSISENGKTACVKRVDTRLHFIGRHYLLIAATSLENVYMGQDILLDDYSPCFEVNIL